MPASRERAELGWSAPGGGGASNERKGCGGYELPSLQDSEVEIGHVSHSMAQAPPTTCSASEGSPPSTPATSRSCVKSDPALDVRSAAPAGRFDSDLDHLLAGVRAMRRPPSRRDSQRGGGSRGSLDSHLPFFAQLDGQLWEMARALPTATELFFMGANDEAQQWCAFLGRVLPPACPPAPLGLLAYGRWSSIHNEDHDPVFDASASTSARAAALTALGWGGQLPTCKALLEHMLHRAEYEYAEHLLDHKFTPGKWCVECVCFCAGGVAGRTPSSRMSLFLTHRRNANVRSIHATSLMIVYTHPAGLATAPPRRCAQCAQCCAVES